MNSVVSLDNLFMDLLKIQLYDLSNKLGLIDLFNHPLNANITIPTIKEMITKTQVIIDDNSSSNLNDKVFSIEDIQNIHDRIRYNIEMDRIISDDLRTLITLNDEIKEIYDKMIDFTVNKIFRYLEMVNVGTFITDYFKCRYGIVIEISEIYGIKKENFMTIEIININKAKKTIPKKADLQISSDSIFIFKDNEIKTIPEYIKMSNDEITDHCNSIFWKYYMLSGNYLFENIALNTKKLIKNVIKENKLINDDSKNIFNGYVDLLNNLKINEISGKVNNNFYDARIFNKYVVDQSVLNIKL